MHATRTASTICGEEAARSVASRLARYSLSPEAYAQWRDEIGRAAAASAPKEGEKARQRL